jgi:hypothetical protein
VRVGREPGRAQIPQRFLHPDLGAGADLDVPGVGGIGHREGPVPERALDGPDLGVLGRHVGHEVVVEPVAGAVAPGIDDRGHDVELAVEVGRGAQGRPMVDDVAGAHGFT